METMSITVKNDDQIITRQDIIIEQINSELKRLLAHDKHLCRTCKNKCIYGSHLSNPFVKKGLETADRVYITDCLEYQEGTIYDLESVKASLKPNHNTKKYQITKHRIVDPTVRRAIDRMK